MGQILNETCETLPCFFAANNHNRSAPFKKIVEMHVVLFFLITK